MVEINFSTIFYILICNKFITQNMEDNRTPGCTFSLGILPSVLTVIFVIGQVFGFISWSWWWVFSPLWIMALIFIFLIILYLIGIALGIYFDYKRFKR